MRQKLRKIIVGIAPLLLLLACSEVEERPLQTGSITISDMQFDTTADSAAFQDLNGMPLEVSNFTGRKVVLNYWATWCAPCIRELPALSRAAEILGPEGYIFLLASDEPLETITTFIAENEFSGNFIKLNTFFAIHGIQAVPSTVLYDESGQEVKSWLGAYEWDNPELLSEIRSL
jgi:thiol-disulfide isomerase/thioredoxin